ncbi:MAG: PQQ-like beta-propeller repeat protein [Bacteroidales bacterium]|nr:PQQ-like beta-propeller repeat protein [Bacteroidales bacterium]
MKRRLSLLCLAALLTAVACTKEPEDKPTAPTEIETPRSLTATGGKVYVSCYSPRAVLRIDTATMQPDAICRLGNYNPEGLCIVGNRLYVTSTFITDEQSAILRDNKLYVIDLSSFTIVDTIVVGLNPTHCQALDDNHLVVAAMGDYESVDASTVVVDLTSKSTTSLPTALYNFDIIDHHIVGYTSPYSGSGSIFVDIDPTTNTSTPITLPVSIGTPYGINADTVNGLLYITDGAYNTNGDVHCYDLRNNKYLWKAEAAIFPSKVVTWGNEAFVLNEGAWGRNDASLSRLNSKNGTIVNNYFASVNSRGLGDVAQDIMIYGSKMYISVSFSNTVEVVNPTTGKSQQLKLLLKS